MEKTPSIGDRVRVGAPLEVHNRLYNKGNGVRRVKVNIGEREITKGRYFNGTIGEVPDSMRPQEDAGITVVTYSKNGSPDVEVVTSRNFRVDLDGGGFVLVPEDKIEVL